MIGEVDSDGNGFIFFCIKIFIFVRNIISLKI